MLKYCFYVIDMFYMVPIYILCRMHAVQTCSHSAHALVLSLHLPVLYFRDFVFIPLATIQTSLTWDPKCDTYIYPDRCYIAATYIHTTRFALCMTLNQYWCLMCGFPLSSPMYTIVVA